ncbi:unnamed protein product [Owenia fusiformis]|uniref:Uncharacterized protein n=1 Tax=Owenia fusiformis TaxID=6347 RepID=A0A8J1THJ6_OWEFU|nr:unnamed protein product [Owenia fusiformis]
MQEYIWKATIYLESHDTVALEEEAFEQNTDDEGPEPETPIGRAGNVYVLPGSERFPTGAIECDAEHSGYEVTTLTADGRYAGTTDQFKIKMYAGSEWTEYSVLNNPGKNRGRKEWDRYLSVEALNDEPVSYIRIEHVSGTNGWQIATVFVRHMCTNKIYEFNCGGCWIDRPHIPYRNIKRTSIY